MCHILFAFQVDKFSIEAVDLGQVFKIRIRHDNSMIGADWNLDQVEVLDLDTEEVYMFLCERWLSTKKEDKRIERTFFVKVCYTWVMVYYSVLCILFPISCCCSKIGYEKEMSKLFVCYVSGLGV